MSTTVDILCLTLRALTSTTVDILCFNPYNTDVDYSRHSVFLLAPVQPVVKSTICLQSGNTDIC